MELGHNIGDEKSIIDPQKVAFWKGNGTLDPLFQGNIGWWNVIICLDLHWSKYCQVLKRHEIIWLNWSVLKKSEDIRNLFLKLRWSAFGCLVKVVNQYATDETLKGSQ